MSRRPRKQSTVLQVVETLSSDRKRDFTLQIDRDMLFDSVVQYLKQENIEYNKLSIKFIPEDWVCDSGGVCKEMFTLFFEECLSPARRMFEGEEHVWFPTNDRTALDNRLFFCLGKAIVLSLVSGGAGFPYLSGSCLSYLEDEQLYEGFGDYRKDMTRKLLRIIEQVKNFSYKNFYSANFL